MNLPGGEVGLGRNRGPSFLTSQPVARSVAVAAATILIMIGIFVLLGEGGLFSLPFIVQHISGGVGPALASVLLTTVSFGIGFLLALPLGVVRAFPPRRSRGPRSTEAVRPASRIGYVLRWAAYGVTSGYVQTVRGTPFLVQMFIVFYAIIFEFPRFTLYGLNVSFWAGLLALTINTTGYQAEALRGGFQSVDASQIEAGQAIGLTRFQIFRRITLPQGIRLVTLPLTNEWISNFKTCAILSYIAVVELFFWSRTDIALQLARPIEAFVMIAIFYLAINVTLSRVVTFVEARRRIPGLGTPALVIAQRSA